MENVVLTVHLILAVLLIGVVLLQRSEGGGLGLGGGGGNVLSARQAANALSRATWLLAGGFLITSVALTVLAARNASVGSVVDRIAPNEAPAAPATGNLPALPKYTPPPGAGQPVLPPVGAAAPGAAAPAATVPAATSPAAAAPESPANTPAAAPASSAPTATGSVTTPPSAGTTGAPAATPAPAPAPTTGAGAPAGGTATTVTVPLSAPAPNN